MTENSNRQVVINVVSSLEQTRQNDFEELQTEFENSTRLINGLFEVCECVLCVCVCIVK